MLQIRLSPSMRSVTISSSNGVLDLMKVRVAARHISYRGDDAVQHGAQVWGSPHHGLRLVRGRLLHHGRRPLHGRDMLLLPHLRRPLLLERQALRQGLGALRLVAHRMDDISAIFRVADKDNSGTLTIKEINDVLGDICERYPQVELYLKSKQMKNLVDLLKESEGNAKKETMELSIEQFKKALENVDSQVKNLPATAQIFRSPVSRQGSCLTYQSSHHFETELMHDLKNDVAKIHHEMSELRKMLETCMDGQSKLQNLIRGEVSSMIYDSVGISYLLHSSQRAPTKRGTCCVCHEMQVDSLLYRCGHMCTCYKCAQELQWGTGRCPVCRAQIDDVVRAFFETTTS